jgi:hypothetical protein
MKLEKAIRLMNEDYQGYKEFLGDQNSLSSKFYQYRVASLLDYVNFRMDEDCPDVEEYERKAAKAIRKYAHEQSRKLVEQLIPVDAAPF